MKLRVAGAEDADQVASLHAGSWRRHYRGAYADSYLDGDVVSDRRAVWSMRLSDQHGTATVLAEDDATLVGFVHVIFDRDDRWGSLVDNLHVIGGRQRTGVGSALLDRAAKIIIEQATSPSMYLWVLEQNIAAQHFYRARGGEFVEKALVPPPGGDASRLNGSPACLRYAWASLT